MSSMFQFLNRELLKEWLKLQDSDTDVGEPRIRSRRKLFRELKKLSKATDDEFIRRCYLGTITLVKDRGKIDAIISLSNTVYFTTGIDVDGAEKLVACSKIAISVLKRWY